MQIHEIIKRRQTARGSQPSSLDASASGGIEQGAVQPATSVLASIRRRKHGGAGRDRDRIGQLRTRESQMEAAGGRARQPAHLALICLFRDAASEITRVLRKHNPELPMCKNYGHVVSKESAAALPVCQNCGLKLTSKAQLRTAVAREVPAK